MRVRRIQLPVGTLDVVCLFSILNQYSVQATIEWLEKEWHAMNDSAPQVNPRKLFVGNLSWSLTEDMLRDFFAQFGEIVDLKIIIDRATGRSKGIAFVEFADEAMAQAAIDGANGTELEGRALVVNIARPPAPRDPNRGGYNRGGYGGGSNSGGYNNNRNQGSYDRSY
jgi:RNA recognition motif-containing protein